MPKKKQRVYVVSITKEFKYPEFTTDSENTLEDLQQKATSDFLEQIRNSNYNPQELEFKVEATLPYNLDKHKPLGISGTLINGRDRPKLAVGTYIQELILKLTTEKFGPIDYEVNPSIFLEKIEKKTDLGSVYTQYILKPEVEAYRAELNETLSNIFLKLAI